MEFVLSDVEVRVLGALIEKEITTPEYYPLSLNALVNACNQKSNREPVMSLTSDETLDACESLQDRKLVLRIYESRAEKFSERLGEHFNFDRRELAVVCVLLLRGAQTVGEIRGRTGRMYEFTDLEGVEHTLERLSERGLVKRLSRQPGHKEERWAHLFAGDVEEVPGVAVERSRPSDRVSELESQVSELRSEVRSLSDRLQRLESLLT